MNEYQPDLLLDSLMEGNHENLNYSKIIKLINSNGKTQCCKVRRVFRYYTPNKYSLSKKYAHHLFFLFFPFRSEKELLGEHLSTYQGKLAEPCVMDLLMKINKSLSLMQLWLTRHMKISIQNF